MCERAWMLDVCAWETGGGLCTCCRFISRAPSESVRRLARRLIGRPAAENDYLRPFFSLLFFFRFLAEWGGATFQWA